MNRGASTVLALGLGITGGVMLWQSRHAARPVGEYAATAIIQVTRPSFDGPSANQALNAERSILESSALIEGVISNLNLSAKWTGPNGPASPAEARDRLRSSMEVAVNESSEQITLRVAGPDKQGTEEIAQSALRVYDELRRTRLKRSKPKNIVVLEDQLEDLEPKLRLALETMESLGKEITTEEVYTPARNEPTLLDRIREGKEEEPADNSSTLFGNEPVPRNETPEQTKRRIYLRSRRVAEVLTLRKERLDARLDYERSRTSTSESPRAQVAQQPEAVRQETTAQSGPAPGRDGKLAGWSCIFGGALWLARIATARKRNGPVAAPDGAI